MGLVQAKKCDVTGSFHRVRRFRITLAEIFDDRVAVTDDWDAYLSPSALKRAIKFIERGMSPTPKKDPEQDATKDMPPVEHPAEAPNS